MLDAVGTAVLELGPVTRSFRKVEGFRASAVGALLVLLGDREGGAARVFATDEAVGAVR